MQNPERTIFTIKWGAYTFQPSLKSTAGAVLLFPLLILLGFWQLDRAQQKQTLTQQYEKLQQAKPASLQKIQQTVPIQYQPVEVTGTFDNANSFLLDNRSYQHQIGYDILTPFIPNNQESAVLINRGWISQGVNRQTLPKIKAIDGEVTITGIIYWPTKAFVLSNKNEPQTNWPHVIQRIDIPTLINELPYNLMPFTIMQNQNEPGSYPREWVPVVTAPSKHIGYALQWFSFALILMVIYITINTKRVKTDHV